MNFLPFLLCLMSQLNPALSSLLPAPVNLTVHSVNFHHFLRWDPGPGTPPGAHYRIYRISSDESKRELEWLSNATTTSVKLQLEYYYERYLLTVRAFYNNSESPESSPKGFTPFSDTKIGAPTLSLAGCGNCIHVNISLPEPDPSSGVEDIHLAFRPTYKVQWRKRNEAREIPFRVENKSFTLKNLELGAEYCIQVQPDFSVTAAAPSDWECAFTSIPEPNRGPLVFGIVFPLLILVFGGVMVFIFFLYYTGFICKLKATLPRALIAALSRGYILTPERTIPDQISISLDKKRTQTNPTAPQPANRGANSDEEEDEEEEEEGLNIYIDRAADLSSASTGGSVKTEVEAQYEGRDVAEGAAEVPLTPGEGQTGVQGHVGGEGEEQEEEELEEEQEEEELEEEEVHDSSGNVNLFSVTLASMAVYEEEEEEEEENTTADSLTAFLKQPTDTQTAAQYKGRPEITWSNCMKGWKEETQEEEEEEEEEEEFSGYMRHT